MAKYRLYPYEPLNPEKYKGDTIPIVFRSSWELEFAQHCDLMPSVLSWSYETQQIPYKDPITGKQKIYIPDFFVEIAQKDGYAINYVFEIKPMHEQKQEHARNSHDAALVARNNAKWAAASMWCDRHSAIFEVLNEGDLYAWHDKKAPRKRQVAGFTPTHSTSKPKSTKFKSKSKSLKQGKTAVSRMRSRVSKAGKSRSVSKTGRIKKR